MGALSIEICEQSPHALEFRAKLPSGREQGCRDVMFPQLQGGVQSSAPAESPAHGQSVHIDLPQCASHAYAVPRGSRSENDQKALMENFFYPNEFSNYRVELVKDLMETVSNIDL